MFLLSGKKAWACTNRFPHSYTYAHTHTHARTYTHRQTHTRTLIIIYLQKNSNDNQIDAANAFFVAIAAKQGKQTSRKGVRTKRGKGCDKIKGKKREKETKKTHCNQIQKRFTDEPFNIRQQKYTNKMNSSEFFSTVSW